MRIAQDVHLIECPLEGIFTGVYAILGEGIVLLDAGLAASPETVIFPYLRGIGRDPSEISLVIVTHGHDDHCGGAAAIKRAAGAKIAAQDQDVPYVENPTRLWRVLHRRYPRYYPKPAAEEGKGTEVDLLLRDGMHIDLGPFEVEVVHTPGHTDGSICLYAGKRGMLFTGDSVQGRGTVLQSGPLIYGEVEDYLSSMERLKSLDPKAMLLDHQYLPLDRAILVGDDVMRMLDLSIGCMEEISAMILNEIRSHAMDMDQLVEKVRAVYSANPAAMSPCSVVDAVLRSLQKRGLIQGFDAGRWEPMQRYSDKAER
jgi:glyoxylase-like metal-dependent hydrolase (beta-lactamase superfamily II)